MEEKALIFCVKAHEGQYRRNGLTPYASHPIAVGEMFPEGSSARIIGYLHDILEDTDITFETIASEFTVKIAEACRVLTHPVNEEYMDYIRRVSYHEIGKQVKIADIIHNLSDNPSDKQRLKYTEALKTLCL